jgi:aspartyl-tRNA(Asn)/glutamyl-tRNA(Gln) amidotransferase subunit B
MVKYFILFVDLDGTYMEYEAVIGLEVHAELLTQSKMFCSCPIVDSTRAQPNVAVCPVCAGMPGVLPVVNRQAVEYGIRVALALECQVAHHSIFARKNYFYPDLPKGYQITQFEHPLAENGKLAIATSHGERIIRIRRVHLEEDAGKLTHIKQDMNDFSLVDLNRAGVGLLEIVSEPDMHSAEEAYAYATQLRSIVRALGVNSGDMEKGVIRFEANVSVRLKGSQVLGTRTEVKNLNSFRALERSILYEIERQKNLLDSGEIVHQETLGWDDINNMTISQRSKEEAHDYRYFPEPDLPPLVVDQSWIDRVASSLPELPRARINRLQKIYGINASDAVMLGAENEIADYFEAAVKAGTRITPRLVANWIIGELFAWMNQTGERMDTLKVTPEKLVELLNMVDGGEININTGKAVLIEMLTSEKTAFEIASERGLGQISDSQLIAEMVRKVLDEYPEEMAAYLAGKETLSNWFFGQVMHEAKKQANPQVLREELLHQLKNRKSQ